MKEGDDEEPKREGRSHGILKASLKTDAFWRRTFARTS